MRILIALLLAGTPGLAFAQGTIQTFLVGVYDLINFYVVPLLVTIAVLFFVYNTVQYFIIKAHDQAGREKARSFMLWSIIAFVIIVALWGIVNFLIGGIGLRAGTSAPCPDYLPSSACPDQTAPIPRPRPGGGSQTAPAPGNEQNAPATSPQSNVDQAASKPETLDTVAVSPDIPSGVNLPPEERVEGSHLPLGAVTLTEEKPNYTEEEKAAANALVEMLSEMTDEVIAIHFHELETNDPNYDSYRVIRRSQVINSVLAPGTTYEENLKTIAAMKKGSVLSQDLADQFEKTYTENKVLVQKLIGETPEPVATNAEPTPPLTQTLSEAATDYHEDETNNVYSEPQLQQLNRISEELGASLEAFDDAFADNGALIIKPSKTPACESNPALCGSIRTILDNVSCALDNHEAWTKDKDMSDHEAKSCN